MEIFGSIFAIALLLTLLFFVLKPQKEAKSKEQKQDEIRLAYKKRLQTELGSITNPEERQKRKIVLLKHFAKELEFNLFFDKDEVKTLIQTLAAF